MHICMANPSGQGPALSQWEDVRFFLAVVRKRSFSGAARELESDPSTVSRRIAVLEDSLGSPLFERGARTVRLTPNAETLIEPALAAERAMLLIEDTARRAESEPRGRVRIALTEGLAQHVVVPLVLPALFASYPDLTVELRTSDAVADLERHEADIALRFFRPRSGELIGRRVARLPLAIVCASSQKKAFGKLRPDELPWTSYELSLPDMPESVALGRIGARPRLVCSSVETQLAAVRAGLGVAIAPAAFVRALPDLEVLSVSASLDLGQLDLFVVTRVSIRHVPRIAVVYEALVRVLQELEEPGSRRTSRRGRPARMGVT